MQTCVKRLCNIFTKKLHVHVLCSGVCGVKKQLDCFLNYIVAIAHRKSTLLPVKVLHRNFYSKENFNIFGKHFIRFLEES